MLERYVLALGIAALTANPVSGHNLNGVRPDRTDSSLVQMVQGTNFYHTFSNFIDTSKSRFSPLTQRSQETGYGSLFGSHGSNIFSMSLTWIDGGSTRQTYFELDDPGEHRLLLVRDQFGPKPENRDTNLYSLKGWEERTYVVDVESGKIIQSYEGSMTRESAPPFEKMSTPSGREYQSQRGRLEPSIGKIVYALLEYLNRSPGIKIKPDNTPLFVDRIAQLNF